MKKKRVCALLVLCFMLEGCSVNLKSGKEDLDLPEISDGQDNITAESLGGVFDEDDFIGDSSEPAQEDTTGEEWQDDTEDLLEKDDQDSLLAEDTQEDILENNQEVQENNEDDNVEELLDENDQEVISEDNQEDEVINGTEDYSGSISIEDSSNIQVSAEDDIDNPKKLKLWVGEIDIGPLIEGLTYRPKYNFNTTVVIDEKPDSEDDDDSNNNEVAAEPVETKPFDSEMAEMLGVNAPVIDDWFPYVRNEFNQVDNVWQLVEVGTQDKSKIIKIFISKDEIEKNEEQEMIEDVINTKDVELCLREDGSNYALWKCGDIYYRMDTVNVSSVEFQEVLAYVIDLTR